MKNLTWQNPEQLFVAQELINKVKSKCCGIKEKKIEVVEKLNSSVPNESKHIVLSDNDWTELEVFLNSVEDLFVSRLKKEHPNLSNADVRLMMLLRLKLSQKTLASIYCVSEKAIKQKLFLYKDKVGIKNEHFSLRNYIENF